MIKEFFFKFVKFAIWFILWVLVAIRLWWLKLQRNIPRSNMIILCCLLKQNVTFECSSLSSYIPFQRHCKDARYHFIQDIQLMIFMLSYNYYLLIDEKSGTIYNKRFRYIFHVCKILQLIGHSNISWYFFLFLVEFELYLWIF